MNNNILGFLKRKEVLFGLICVLFISIGLTVFLSFSSNTGNIENQEEQNILIKSMTPVYDKGSTVVVNDDEVVFNDKKQTVKYKVVIENT